MTKAFTHEASFSSGSGNFPPAGGAASLNAAGEEQQPAPALHILVVDDNADSATTMGFALEIQGHQVRLAHSGPEAIAAAEATPPDIVLLDIGMPGMNGYETCAAMRRMPGLEKTVFIAQTGWGQEEHRKLSREAGFTHHLVKPVEIATLVEVISSICRARG
jgi:CheY-like chemotaxis protein